MRRVAILVVGAALAAVSCADLYESDTSSSTGTEPTTTTPIAVEAAAQAPVSPDGRLRLEVPPGYPRVTVETVAATAARIATPFEVLGSYDLGPDGMVFAEPVRVIFDTFLPAASTPVPIIGLFIGHPGDWVLIEGYRVDASGPTIVVEAEVDHFSQIIVTRDLARTFTSNPSAAVATESLHTEVTWSLVDSCPSTDPADIGTAIEDHCTYRKALADNVVVASHPFSTGAAVVDPGTPPTAFPQEPPAPSETSWVAATGRSVVECSGPGEGSYGLEVALTAEPAQQTLGPGPLMRLLFGVEDARTSGSVSIDQTYVLPAGRLLCGDDSIADLIAVTSGIGADSEDLSKMVDGFISDARRDLLLPGSAGRVTRIVDVASIDITGSAVLVSDLDRAAVVRLFDDAWFACGETGAHGFATVCPSGVGLMPSGRLVMLGVIHGAPVVLPTGAGSVVYGAFFETNGDPSDDLRPAEDAEWDLAQGTDRRYRLTGTADGWSLIVSGPASGTAPASSVRVLIKGSTVVWLIPAAELGDDPLARVTAVIDDRSGDASGVAGDVLGPDPTGPLLPVLP